MPDTDHNTDRKRAVRLGRTLGALALAGLAALVLASRPVLTARAVPPGPRGRIPVRYWHMWSGEWQPVMDQVVAEFNRSQDRYEVIPLQVPVGESGTKFLLSVAGGDPPDVMAQWAQSSSAWAQAGVLQPLDARMTAAERREFLTGTYPAIHQSGWYKGHLYGLATCVDVYACYYRPDQFRAAGLDPDRFPATLEALTADARRLDVADASGHYARLGFLPQTLTAYAPAFGGGFYDPAAGRVTLDTPANRRALAYIVAAQRALGPDRVQRFNAGLNSQNGAQWPFIDGSFSVALDGEWRVKQLAEFAPGLDYRVAPLPPPAGGRPLASWSAAGYLTIPTGARHPDGAWAFIKFWSGLDDPAKAAAFNAAFGWLPSSPRMAQAPAYRAFLRRYPQYRAFVRLAASPRIAATPPVAYQVFLMDRLTAADDLAERGERTPAQALAGLERDVARERARRKGLGYDQ